MPENPFYLLTQQLTKEEELPLCSAFYHCMTKCLRKATKGRKTVFCLIVSEEKSIMAHRETLAEWLSLARGAYSFCFPDTARLGNRERTVSNSQGWLLHPPVRSCVLKVLESPLNHTQGLNISTHKPMESISHLNFNVSLGLEASANSNIYFS